jgi:hypothetical protein
LFSLDKDVDIKKKTHLSFLVRAPKLRLSNLLLPLLSGRRPGAVWSYRRGWRCDVAALPCAMVLVVAVQVVSSVKKS